MDLVKTIGREIKGLFISFKELQKIPAIVNSETYYPELRRKSIFVRWAENIIWVFRNQEANQFYNIYGLDVKSGKKAKDYQPYRAFAGDRDKRNLRIGEGRNYAYTAILRDKFLFEKYLNVFQIKTVKTLAVISEKKKMQDAYLEKEIEPEKIFTEGKKRFVKSVDGECADGVFTVIGIKEYRKKLDKLVTGQRYLVQEQLVQHTTMNKLNPNSVNTLRLITVKTRNGVQLFGALQRIGVRKSGDVDNWAVGGLDVEIDKKSGKLMKYGFYKPGYGTKTTTHPDTGMLLEGFEIPYYDEAVELVKRAHDKVYGVHSIGWDVAITKDGPVLVEGNDNYEISMIQLNNGLRKEWKKINAQ